MDMSWATRVKRAKRYKKYKWSRVITGRFTKRDKADARPFSGINVMDELLPGVPWGFGDPCWQMGVQFYDGVMHDDVPLCESTYKKIVKEAAKL